MHSVDDIRLRGIVADRLESLQRAGVLQLPKVCTSIARVDDAQDTPRPTPREPAITPAEQHADAESLNSSPAAADSSGSNPAKHTGWQPVRPASLFDAPTQSSPPDAPAITLEILQQQVAACTRCNELASTRTQTVFGVGNPNARLCFLGEAPGADEDRTGIPFVGRGGQLLTKIIEACRLKREDVYILNMIKCRPPGNRNPLPHELENCRGYLEQQLDLIRPECICCLGAVASKNLLGTTMSIGKLRRKIHSFRGAKVVCTYHPAFLLRSPSFKKETWEDMKLLMREMGVEL